MRAGPVDLLRRRARDQPGGLVDRSLARTRRVLRSWSQPWRCWPRCRSCCWRSRARTQRWILGRDLRGRGADVRPLGAMPAILANVVAPEHARARRSRRRSSTAHLLGDFWSPGPDGLGCRDLRPGGLDDDGLRPAVRRRSARCRHPPRPAPENLTAGMLVVVPAVVLSGLMLLSGARHLPREMALMLAKLRANPRASARTGAR